MFSEESYEEGSRAMARRFLKAALAELIDGGDFDYGRLVAERSEALSTLRQLCREFGLDDQWPENLNLSDAIEKRFARGVHAELEELKRVNVDKLRQRIDQAASETAVELGEKFEADRKEVLDAIAGTDKGELIVALSTKSDAIARVRAECERLVSEPAHDREEACRNDLALKVLEILEGL